MFIIIIVRWIVGVYFDHNSGVYYNRYVEELAMSLGLFNPIEPPRTTQLQDHRIISYEFGMVQPY